MTVNFQMDQSTALLTIQRPEALNAVNAQVMECFESILHDLEREEGVRSVIITGSGDRAFCAGGDFREWQNRLSPEEGRRSAGRMHGLLDRLENLAVPTIAAVNGYAVGGGCELALACDLRLASSTAVFHMAEVTLGLIPGWGGSIRLPRLIGPGRALDMILSGEPVNARRAYETGLVSRLFEPGELLPEAKKLAGRMASFSPKALRLAKKAARAGLEADHQEAKRMEIELFGEVWGGPEHRRAIESFLSRKK